jgi:hypothetical protein
MAFAQLQMPWVIFFFEVGGFTKSFVSLALNLPRTVVMEVGDLTGQGKSLLFLEAVQGI